MKRALISVHDKTGITEFAKQLTELGYEIVASDGTLKTLNDAKIKPVKAVSEVTGFPEILEGRIKTEHPKLVGGILAIKGNKQHMNDLERFEITAVDMVVCNLYPFEKVTQQEGVDLQTALENIDIGGPNMIRAAAKNFENVVVVVDPRWYTQIINEIKQHGDVTKKTRQKLAVEAFKRTSQYDKAIPAFLETRFST
ncbi:MAG: hypothetical protein NWF03_05265 [Candidatus Bathyarchaeota archaeon]|nr:hypothetical protein [Candidatus Bathyarchaeota archaeon]